MYFLTDTYYVIDIYVLFLVIGVGSTSSCHRCVRKTDTAEYACKVIDKRQIEVNFSGLLEQFHVEVKVSIL